MQNSIGATVSLIQTTVFTDKPVSMKYRGVYDLHSKEEGKLIYRARAGTHKLADVVGIWKEKYV